MFRSKKSVLVKRLSKTVANEAERAVESILKPLQLSQLETLALSVDSRGAEDTACLLMAPGNLRLGRRTIAARLLFCQLYRWPDLKSDLELKRLQVCAGDHDMYICVNPYHWSRLYKPDSPPPPYRRHPQELKKYKDISPPPSESQETGGTNHSHVSGCSDQSRPWCSIAYWEQSTRVGRLLPVNQSAINVFADLPHGDGLCLGTLAQTRCTDVSDVLDVRKRIGHGVTIFREDEGVWVYNRSDSAIFVNSHTLDPPNTKNLSVYKVLPGYSIRIFDYEKARYNQAMYDSSLFDDGPFDPNAVRISFVKGWGTRYSRRCITSCPCWLEVIFRVDR